MKFAGCYRLRLVPKIFCRPRIVDKITRSSWDNRAFFILAVGIIWCLFYIMTYTANPNNALPHQTSLVYSDLVNKHVEMEEKDDYISRSDDLETSSPVIEVTKSWLNYPHEKSNVHRPQDRTSYSTGEMNDSGDKRQNDLIPHNSDDKSSNIKEGRVDLLDKYYNTTTITIILLVQMLLWVAYYKMDQNHRSLYNECL